MVDKQTYIERFKNVYRIKNNAELSDELALEYFEKLVSLIRVISSHLPIAKIIINQDGTK